jgi:hypothetical protein
VQRLLRLVLVSARCGSTSLRGCGANGVRLAWVCASPLFRRGRPPNFFTIQRVRRCESRRQPHPSSALLRPRARPSTIARRDAGAGAALRDLSVIPVSGRVPHISTRPSSTSSALPWRATVPSRTTHHAPRQPQFGPRHSPDPSAGDCCCATVAPTPGHACRRLSTPVRRHRTTFPLSSLEPRPAHTAAAIFGPSIARRRSTASTRRRPTKPSACCSHPRFWAPRRHHHLLAGTFTAACSLAEFLKAPCSVRRSAFPFYLRAMTSP